MNDSIDTVNASYEFVQVCEDIEDIEDMAIDMEHSIGQKIININY